MSLRAKRKIVIASEAKQSFPLKLDHERLLRRFAPRNDKLKICFVALLLAMTASCGGGGFVGPNKYPLATPHHPNWPTPSQGSSPSQSQSPPPSDATPDPSVPDSIPSDPFMDQVTSFQPGAYGGFGQVDFPEIVLDGPQGKGSLLGGTDVLSLGVGGTITLKSQTPILDGPGADFIVFENPFWAGGNPQTPYAELGAVSVSQDGQQFFPFSCEKNNVSELFPGCAGVSPVYANVLTNSIDPTDPDVAGGDAFDLADLGLDWILYVRIQDLSSGGGGDTAGFDLDAIAIVHQ